MSKRKGIRPSDPVSLTKNDGSSRSVDPAPTDDFTEDNFKNLKDKIAIQLKQIDNSSAKKQKLNCENNRKTDENKRGKKRTADGQVVAPKNGQDAKPSTINASESGTLNEEEELRAALKELGGTEEDLELLAGADSESELEGSAAVSNLKPDKSRKGINFEEGMANILKEIALAQGQQEESSAEEGTNEQHTNTVSKKQDIPVVVPVTTLAETKSGKKSTANSKLKCQPRPDWFNISNSNTDLEINTKIQTSQPVIDALHSYAKVLLSTENDNFKSSQQSSSSQTFYNTVIASGTLSDKISALTLAVQESPIHNVKALETMIGLAGKRSRGQAIDVLRALKDLFAQGFLLPSDRRLYAFATQPALLAATAQVRSWSSKQQLPQGLRENYLICWAFEDWLKQQYFEILKILEVWCNDEIEFARGRAISYISDLLKEKPEQESNLLRLLVNKLGDPVKKIASQTSYLLMQLLSTHPAMKMVVISAIESDFIFRPGQSMHGKYYAAVTLNQTVLSVKEEEVAQKLLGIYFGLFTALLKPAQAQAQVKAQPDEAESIESRSRSQQRRRKDYKATENLQEEELREKLISAVLTGVNRAYPYVGSEHKTFESYLETLFRITHSANFNTSIQAMLLIQQMTSTHSASSDRFYRTLYESLLDPRLMVASKQQLYLNLLHRSLKADTNVKRIKAFVKRLLQVLSLHDASFICGVFFLLKDLETNLPSLTSMIDQPEDNEDDEEVFRDVVEDDDNEALKSNTNDQAVQGQRYDGTKRAPEHANADNSCAWEVLPFIAHYHPSVTVSTDHYISHTQLPGKPDLTLHTLIHFLDRFVYRNPKLASNKLRGSSIMQPMASDDREAVLISSGSRQTMPAVNTDEFRNKRGEDVAAEEVFFHKYFTTLGVESKSKTRKQDVIDDDGSVGDEGEDAVWKAMMQSAADLEGDISDNDDVDMSDFEDEMNDLASSEDDGGISPDESLDEDDDEGVDIEAGIFDETDDEMADNTDDEVEAVEDDMEFTGLESDLEQQQTKPKGRKEKHKADKEKRKKMKALPTFASADDYAKMLENDDDEDLG